MTWYSRILVRVALFSGFTRLSTVPAGSFPNAASVGAKTVKGPGPLSVSTRPAALTAATSVVWIGEFTAFSTMVLDGDMAAPPTMGSFICADALNEVIARAATAIVARSVFFMSLSFVVLISKTPSLDSRALIIIYA